MEETSVSKWKIILNSYDQGYSYSPIADIMKRSRFTIQSVIKRFSNQETVISAPRCGLSEKLSVREKRGIINIVKKNPLAHRKLQQSLTTILIRMSIR